MAGISDYTVQIEFIRKGGDSRHEEKLTAVLTGLKILITGEPQIGGHVVLEILARRARDDESRRGNTVGLKNHPLLYDILTYCWLATSSESLERSLGAVVLDKRWDEFEANEIATQFKEGLKEWEKWVRQPMLSGAEAEVEQKRAKLMRLLAGAPEGCSSPALKVAAQAYIRLMGNQEIPALFRAI